MMNPNQPQGAQGRMPSDPNVNTMGAQMAPQAAQMGQQAPMDQGLGLGLQNPLPQAGAPGLSGLQQLAAANQGPQGTQPRPGMNFASQRPQGPMQFPTGLPDQTGNPMQRQTALAQALRGQPQLGNMGGPDAVQV